MAMNESKARPRLLQVTIILLVVASAAIHLSRAQANPRISLLFSLNAFGYLALVALLYLPLPWLQHWQGWVRKILIGYTALTFVLFFVWGLMAGEWPAIGLIDKVIEVVIIGLLWQEERLSRSLPKTLPS